MKAVGMNTLTNAAMAVAVIASLLLIYGAIRLIRVQSTRTRGWLMLAAALVILMNVMIWTA
jgi:hypothetical protein